MNKFWKAQKELAKIICAVLLRATVLGLIIYGSYYFLGNPGGIILVFVLFLWAAFTAAHMEGQ